jgi:membrane-bound metal-dependent hydrolase YbcI (DUF457 family)
MRLLTHTAFGLFLGTVFYYLFNLDVGFILLTGFAAFLPDVDWIMEFSWGFGSVHRKLLHNVWFLTILTLLVLFLFREFILVLAVIVGFTSHLLIDSFTVTGVYWLYPIGKYHLKGPFSMSRVESKSIEKYLQTAFFTSSGLIFLAKQIPLSGVFSYEGIILIGALLIVGYYLFKVFGKVLERIIRSLFSTVERV